MSCMMGNRELFWSQCRGIGLNLDLNWATRDISHSCGDISVLRDLLGISGGISVLPSSKSRLLTCLIGNKELLCTQRRVSGLIFQRAGSLMDFSSCSWKLGYVLELLRRKSLKNFVCSATSGLLSSYDGHIRNLK